MTQTFRLAQGGAIDRSRQLRFRYDGKEYEGYTGDTLASALLANGVHLVARSFKYHRPRGIVAAGSDEPNALVQLERGARTEPNARATQIELYDGLVAASQNCWPSVRFDVGAVADALSRFLPAGFYYKTFMWPPSPAWWLKYERVIRRAGGMGRAPAEPDPARYEQQYAHCDVLVAGGGVAGLAAAHSAAHCGARVIICDERHMLGGSAPMHDEHIDDAPAADWMSRVEGELASHSDVTLLPRTTAFGYYDGNLVGLIERVTDHRPTPTPHVPRQRMWKVRARSVVMATGAIERLVAYPGNDLPGTMQAGAARAYLGRYAVMPGRRAVIFTNNDSAYACAMDLREAGVEVAAIVDARPEEALMGDMPARAMRAGLAVVAASAIVRAYGALHVRAVDVALLGQSGRRRIDCDLVCVSGGWNPAVHLFSQARGKLRYDDALATFVPDASPLPIIAAGAANGKMSLAEALDEGHRAGIAAALRAGCAAAGKVPVPRAATCNAGPLASLWEVRPPHARAKSFVDLQNDVTADDIRLGSREAYRSVEHLKRYTTLGMGTDQGKLSNISGLGLLADTLGVAVSQVGTTTFRPPYTPVTFGSVVGSGSGAHVEPTRYSAMHDWHLAHRARFVNAGLWKRPHSYRRAGESEDDAVNREALNVRSNVGVVDVSTLGKIELQGKDVAEFLNRVYVNRWDTLGVGRCRYGVMLRDDGMVFDDGTTSRLADMHYLMTTTTVNAVRVIQHLEARLQIDWPDLGVYVTSVTEQWSAAALSGPNARRVLSKLVDIDVSNEAFPFLSVAEASIAHTGAPIPARLFRMSYSGELAYEIHVPADRGPALWEALMHAGSEFGIMPYGTEAMSTLRIEKGHIVIGPEADGRTTADDLGMGKLVSAAKWCVGKPLLSRPALVDPQRWQLVGLTAIGGAIPRGAKIVADPDHALPNPMLGHVTSWCWSPTLGASIALALLAGGRQRHGQTLWAISPLADARVQVSVGPPCFVDPEGARLRG